MNIITIIITLLVILLVGYAAFFAYDLFKHKDEFEKETNFWITGVIGAIVNFFDPLGIGSKCTADSFIEIYKTNKR